MNEIWWYLSRSSGIVATALIAAALVAGLRFSGRATGTRRRPKWWLDLHNYLGGLAFVFVVVHIVAVYQDELSGIGWKQILIPMTAEGWAWGITWGVLATYVFAMVVFTSWPRRRGSRRLWLTIHLLSVPAAVAAGVHGWMVGSSRGQVWFPILLAVLVGLVVHPAVLRLFTAARKRASRRLREPPAAAWAAPRLPVGPPPSHAGRVRPPAPSRASSREPSPASSPAPPADDAGARRVLVETAPRSR